MFRRFTRIVALGTAAGLASMAALNAAVDPYDRLGLRVTGVNAEKPAVESRTKLTKPMMASRIRPASVVLGSSRPAHALRPDHRCLDGALQPAFNLAVEGTTIYETLRYLQHAAAVGSLKLALIELDPNQFALAEPTRNDFQEHVLLTPGDTGLVPALAYAKELLTWRMTQDSFATVLGQGEGVLVDRDGRRNETGFERATVRAGGTRALFRRIENVAYIRPMASGREPPWSFEDASHWSFRALRDIVAFARTHAIDVRFFVSPVHARQLEIYHAVGVYVPFEDWKRSVVAILAEDARRNRAAPYALRDFSGYGEITTEPVPSDGDPSARMRGYWETTHYKVSVGDRVLAEMLGCGAVPGSAFGVALSEDNVEAHLARLRRDGERYRAEHTEELRDLADAVAAARAAPRGDR